MIYVQQVSKMKLLFNNIKRNYNEYDVCPKSTETDAAFIKTN